MGLWCHEISLCETFLREKLLLSWGLAKGADKVISRKAKEENGCRSLYISVSETRRDFVPEMGRPGEETSWILDKSWVWRAGNYPLSCHHRLSHPCSLLPQSYSALKKDGQRLSTLMKRGEAVEARPARLVTVYSIALLRFQPPLFTLGKMHRFEIICLLVSLFCVWLILYS